MKRIYSFTCFIFVDLSKMLNINGATLYDIEEASCEKVYKMHNNQLFDATVTALETGNLSPLVKEELKYTIQSRRRAKGQRELKVDFPEQAKYEVKYR